MKEGVARASRDEALNQAFNEAGFTQLKPDLIAPRASKLYMACCSLNRSENRQKRPFLSDFGPAMACDGDSWELSGRSGSSW